MTNKYSFQREIPINQKSYDLIVVGGGPAGCAAAVAAARQGVQVLLIEATGALGGMGTSGLVNAFDPMADGEKNLVAGFMKELVEELYKRGELGPYVTPEWWNKRYMHWTPFSCEGLKRLLDEKVSSAGVDISFFSSLVEVDSEALSKKITGIIINNIEGLSYLKAKRFIDATGDAVLSFMAGAECKTNPDFMPSSLCSLHANIDWEACKHVDQIEAIKKAVKDDFFTQKDLHLPGMVATAKDLGYLNAGHLFGLNSLINADKTKAMIEGRKLLQEYVSFYKKYVPGCENLELVASGALLGVRESRQIVGEYELNFNDYKNRRQFPDQIGVFNKYVDIHIKDTSEEEFERFSEEHENSGRLDIGECFGIPYGILVPQGWQNLWVAGRCNSSDEKVHGSIRVQPAASMMGQAAGTAVAQSLQSAKPAYDIDTKILIQSLREQGVYLPQTQSSRTLTKN